VLVCADVIRVNPGWLLSRGSNLREMIFKTRDPLGFEELRKISQLGADGTRQTARWAQRKIAAVMAFKGGGVEDITVGDCLELLDMPGKSLAWRYTGNSLLMAACPRVLPAGCPDQPQGYSSSVWPPHAGAARRPVSPRE
jgi:hypothetical protein